MIDLAETIRTIPDYPKPGILFRDVTTLMGDRMAFEKAVDEMAAPWRETMIDQVIGIEARGFVLGGALAVALKAGFTPVRKPGKLPFDTISEDYELEYGTDALHMHVDAIARGVRVLIVDDLIATGGTALAAARLARRADADIVGASFLVDLPDLGGAERLRNENITVNALLAFEGH
ncbi:MAG: adenine phosphoribosyltransferase [Pseudomonadota bacterium]